MTDKPSRLAVAIKVTRKTRVIVWNNLHYHMKDWYCFKCLVVARMRVTVFADVGMAELKVFIVEVFVEERR